jgi:hypothetical protein
VKRGAARQDEAVLAVQKADSGEVTDGALNAIAFGEVLGVGGDLADEIVNGQMVEPS